MRRGSTIALCALHLAGNALILWLGYAWLSIAESDAAHLALSALLLLVFGCAALWLHGAALAYFDVDAGHEFSPAARKAAAHLPALLVLGLLAVLLYALLAHWYGSFDHKAFVIGSYFTMKLRKPVAPAKVLHVYHVFIGLLRWLVIPAMLAPVAGAVASRGWRGLRFQRRSRKLLYWIEAGALLLLAVWVPLKLVTWVPEVSGFKLQMASFVARLGAGYLLFVAGLLMLGFVTSTGKPRLSHASTVDSP